MVHLVWRNNKKKMIIAEILASIMGGYFVYMLQKIDKRQDKIEIDIELTKRDINAIKSLLPKRYGDDVL